MISFTRKRILEESAHDGKQAKRQAQPPLHAGSTISCPQNNFSEGLGSSFSDELSSPTVFGTVQPSSASLNVPKPDGDVCFGMILGVKTQFLDDPHIATIYTDANQLTNNYHLLQITMKRIHILQINGRDVCILNIQTSKALQELDRQSLVRYDVYVSANEWAAKIRSFMTMGKSTCLEVSVYFFGTLSNSSLVGRILSDTGHFLQPPDFLDDSIPYNNPHEIVFPSMANHGSRIALPKPENCSLEEQPVDIANTILSGLDHADSLANWEVNREVIRTDLKQHQKAALDFIAHRETACTLEPFSLFKQCVDSRNRTYYECSVTGSRRPEKQQENFGGLIADEMGLGKTLTMISAIATTMQQAHRFQHDEFGIQAMSSTLKKARATLIICPSALLMDGWLEEISKHIAPGFLKCARYHGALKATELEILDSDIVLTTYATLIKDSSRNCVLHKIHWFRITIDEAHFIRHQQTKQFRAVVTLSAKHRWCLTGTPIQNMINDLGALVRFLRVPQLEGPPDFHRHTAGPVEKRNAEGLRRLRELLQCICLRRLKDLLNLPKPISHTEAVQLTIQETNQYQQIGEYHRRAVDRAIASGNLSEASHGLFRAIMQLRLFCNSGLCVDSEQLDSNKSPPSLENDEQIMCSYCSCDLYSVDDGESVNSGTILKCQHTLCPECVDQSEKPACNRTSCVVCGTVSPYPNIKQNEAPTWEQSPVALTGYSSKLTALAQNVIQHQNEKCIIFSSWKKSIRLAASYLTAHNISVCVIDGSLSLPQRRFMIQDFQQNPRISALLMTLGVGAVGLNLTVANRIHILEPQWNPFIERQAIGRVMRLGQDKNVTIVRYIAEKTVEQYVQNRQEKKLHFAEIGWDNNKTGSDGEKLAQMKTIQSLLFTQS